VSNEAPRPYPMPWPDSSKGPYRLRFWVGRVDGRPAIVGVELWGVDPIVTPWPGGLDEDPPWPSLKPRDTAVTAAAIRLPLGKLLDFHVEWLRTYARAARRLREQLEAAGEAVDPGHEERVKAFEARHSGPRSGRTGRKRMTRDRLEEVAAIYLEAAELGARAPSLAVAEHFGAQRATVRTWVRRAADAGLLSKGHPGAVRTRPPEKGDADDDRS